MNYTSTPKVKLSVDELRQFAQKRIIENYTIQAIYWRELLRIAPQFEGQVCGKRLETKFKKAFADFPAVVELREGIVMWKLYIKDERLADEFAFDICYPVKSYANFPNYGIFTLESLLRHNEGVIARQQRDIAAYQEKLPVLPDLHAEHVRLLEQITAFNQKVKDAFYQLRIDVTE